MQFVVDTEFNGFGGELLSMALVAKNGQEFYEVLEPTSSFDPWVVQHVVPHLGKAPISKDVFQDKLELFLLCFATIEVIADWPEDINHFCDALITGPGRRITIPGAGIKFHVRFNLPSTATSSKVPHNALEDARALARHLGWIK